MALLTKVYIKEASLLASENRDVTSLLHQTPTFLFEGAEPFYNRKFNKVSSHQLNS